MEPFVRERRLPRLGLTHCAGLGSVTVSYRVGPVKCGAALAVVVWGWKGKDIVRSNPSRSVPIATCLSPYAKTSRTNYPPRMAALESSGGKRCEYVWVWLI